MSSSASEVPAAKSESAPGIEKAPASPTGSVNAEQPGAAAKLQSAPGIDEASASPTGAPSAEQPAAPIKSGSAPAAASGAAGAVASTEQPTAAASSDGQMGTEAEAGQNALPDNSEASVTREEMERYIKISRDLKLRRGSLMPPGGTLQSGKNINATTTAPIPLCMGAKKKPSLAFETRVELYGRGRIKLSFDGVSDETATAPQVVYQEESATSIAKRGAPSTAITPRRLSLEERAPPPTPAPSLASLYKRSKSQDFTTIPLKDDEHPE